VRDLAVLVLHVLATVARLAGPGGARSVVAESVLVKHQLLILNRSRKRSPNLRPSDRAVAGLCMANSKMLRKLAIRHAQDLGWLNHGNHGFVQVSFAARLAIRHRQPQPGHPDR